MWEMVGRREARNGGKDRKECGVSCSSVTCILVRVKPKDVVHSRLYRPLVGEEKEDYVRVREKRGRNTGEERKRERERRQEEKIERMIEKLRRKRGSPWYVLLNGVGVSARMEE